MLHCTSTFLKERGRAATSKLPHATGSRAHGSVLSGCSARTKRGVAVCWLAELDLVGWYVLAGRTYGRSLCSADVESANPKQTQVQGLSNARFPGVPGVPKYLGTWKSPFGS